MDEIQGELGKLYFDGLALENSAQRVRALGGLLTLAVRCLEVGELEERLEALEARVGNQPRRIA